LSLSHPTGITLRALDRHTLDRLEEAGLWSLKDEGKHCLFPYPYAGSPNSLLERDIMTYSAQEMYGKGAVVSSKAKCCLLAIIPNRDAVIEEGDETGD